MGQQQQQQQHLGSIESSIIVGGVVAEEDEENSLKEEVVMSPDVALQRCVVLFQSLFYLLVIWLALSSICLIYFFN